ncbi:MAG: FecR domain-containing protein [Spirochaetes bacterium]|nr:FecR domain-containing protein [Spirochaetota bacterium]
MKRSISIFIALILFTGAGVSVLEAQKSEKGESYGKVTYKTGKALVKRNDKRTEQLKVGTKIYEGNLIKSYNGARLSISLPTGIMLQVKDTSVISLDKYLSKEEKNESKIKVFLGSLKIKLEKLKKTPNNLTIDTPTAVVGVRGTFFWATVLKDLTRVEVIEGRVTIQDNGNIGPSQIVNAGFASEVQQGQAASVPVPVRSSGGSSQDDTSAPVILVIRPAGNLEVSRNKNYTVKFIVTDENLERVAVNGVQINGAVSGALISVPVVLQPGINKIVIKAEDVNRKSTEVKKTIQYQHMPPNPPKR